MFSNRIISLLLLGYSTNIFCQEPFAPARGRGVQSTSSTRNDISSEYGTITELKGLDGPILVLHAKSKILEIYLQSQDQDSVTALIGKSATIVGEIRENRIYVLRVVAGTKPTAEVESLTQSQPTARANFICEFKSTSQFPEPDSYARSRVYGGSFSLATESSTVSGEKKNSLYEALASACTRCAPGNRSLGRMQGYVTTTTCELIKCIDLVNDTLVGSSEVNAIVPSGCTGEASQRFASEGQTKRQRAIAENNGTIAEQREAIDAKFRNVGPPAEISPGIRGPGSGPFVDYGKFYQGRSYPSHPSQVGGN